MHVLYRNFKIKWHPRTHQSSVNETHTNMWNCNRCELITQWQGQHEMKLQLLWQNILGCWVGTENGTWDGWVVAVGGIAQEGEMLDWVKRSLEGARLQEGLEGAPGRTAHMSRGGVSGLSIWWETCCLFAYEKMERASPLFLLDLVPMGYSWRTASSPSFLKLFLLLLSHCNHEHCTQKVREHTKCDVSIMESFLSRKQHTLHLGKVYTLIQKHLNTEAH